MIPYAVLLNTAHFYDIECRGNFKAGEARMRKCLDIRLKHLKPDDESICAAYVNMGNVMGSSYRFEEAVAWFKKAENLVVMHKEWPLKKLLVDMNASRVYYHMGQYEESARRLDAALKEAARFKSVFWAVRSALPYIIWRRLVYANSSLAQIFHTRRFISGLEILLRPENVAN